MEARTEEPKEYFSPDELATWLGIGRTMAYRLLSSDEIPSFKIGRRRIVSRRDVEAYLEQQRAHAIEQAAKK
jgi:excisionase family DNA binding protein